MLAQAAGGRTNVDDDTVVQTTIIDCAHNGSVVTFDGTEGSSTSIEGFSIVNGEAGISGNGTRATIRRNVITGKWGIDATKPPLTREEDRARFERTVPPRAGEARLEDFL